uniref:Uncharacterized protein n=1 Tax=Physcomitrium patens TaxID=3218 RepID=A0A2K1KN24_PHYPA|nr:hypothetical protein PHYPA_006069 [Physcomitrium patens]
MRRLSLYFTVRKDFETCEVFCLFDCLFVCFEFPYGLEILGFASCYRGKYIIPFCGIITIAITT